MADAYMQYEHEDTGLAARWYGGEYIDIGYIAEVDTGPFNDRNQPSFHKGEFVSTGCINVWNHSEDKARIPFTLEALEQEVIDFLDEEGML